MCLQLGAQDVVLLFEFLALLPQQFDVHRQFLHVFEAFRHAGVRLAQSVDVFAGLC